MRVFVAAFIVVVSVSLAQAERRVALVFGADRYEHIRPLTNAVNDARAVEDALDALGFEVFSETNRSLKRMRRALEDFAEDAAGADVAFVFFAGHGVEIAGENRLLPTDASTASLDALKASSLSLEELRETVAKVAKIGLIVLDACRNDPFSVISDPEGRGVNALRLPKTVKPGLGRMGRAENTLFAFSAAPGETASDGEDGNSPFTTALTKYLGTEGLEIRSVLTLVQQEVYDRSRGMQLPYVESGLPSLFFASETTDELPERERLLLAMAEVDADLRADVERIAQELSVPLAAIYGAVIGTDINDRKPKQRRRILRDAAQAFIDVRDQIRRLSSSDERVTKLRSEAEAQYALGAYETARALMSKAVELDVSSQESLSENLNKRILSEAATRYLMGRAAAARTDYKVAISDYEAAISRISDLTTNDYAPELVRQHGDLLVALARAHLSDGNNEAAISGLRQNLTLMKSRSDRSPDNLEWRLDTTIAMNRLANTLVGQHQWDEGLELFFESYLMREEMVEFEPDNPKWQHYFANAHTLAARTERRTGRNLLDIRSSLSSALDIRKEIDLSEDQIAALSREAGSQHYPPFPSYEDLRRSLHRNYLELGTTVGQLSKFDIADGVEDDYLARAWDLLQTGRFIAFELVLDSPDNPAYQEMLADSDSRIGDLYMDAGDPAEALVYFEERRDELATRVAENPDSQFTLNLLADQYLRVAEAQRKLGDYQSALLTAVVGMETVDRLIASNPNRYSTEISKYNFLVEKGKIETLLGDADSMLNTLGDAIPYVVNLDNQHPEFYFWHRNLVHEYAENGRAYFSDGNLDAARSSFMEAKEIANVVKDKLALLGRLIESRNNDDELDSELKELEQNGWGKFVNDYDTWQLELWGLQNDFGLIHEKQGETHDAMKSFEAGYQHLINYANSNFLYFQHKKYYFYSIDKISSIAKSLNMSEKAVRYLKDAVQLLVYDDGELPEDFDDRYRLMTVYSSLAELGENSRENLKRAIALSKELEGEGWIDSDGDYTASNLEKRLQKSVAD